MGKAPRAVGLKFEQQDELLLKQLMTMCGVGTVASIGISSSDLSAQARFAIRVPWTNWYPAMQLYFQESVPFHRSLWMLEDAIKRGHRPPLPRMYFDLAKEPASTLPHVLVISLVSALGWPLDRRGGHIRTLSRMWNLNLDFSFFLRNQCVQWLNGTTLHQSSGPRPDHSPF